MIFICIENYNFEIIIINFVRFIYIKNYNSYFLRYKRVLFILFLLNINNIVCYDWSIKK